MLEWYDHVFLWHPQHFLLTDELHCFPLQLCIRKIGGFSGKQQAQGRQLWHLLVFPWSSWLLKGQQATWWLAMAFSMNELCFVSEFWVHQKRHFTRAWLCRQNCYVVLKIYLKVELWFFWVAEKVLGSKGHLFLEKVGRQENFQERKMNVDLK
jgi:hypothetical protein